MESAAKKMGEKGSVSDDRARKHLPDASRDLVFGLPNSVFGPISSPARRAYARLLLSIHRDFLGGTGGMPQLSQAQVIRVISDLMEAGEDFVEEFAPDSHNANLSTKPVNVYRRLVDAGWFDEQFFGFEIYVTMRRSVSELLSALDRIEKGESVNFHGPLQTVDIILDKLIKDPTESAMILDQMVRMSLSFNQTMRILLEDIRLNEREIMKQSALEELVVVFFDSFVERMITDYKALKDKYNPIRIARSVLSKTQIISSDESIVEAIARGYVASGRADDQGDAVSLVLHHLSQISDVFVNVRSVVDQINDARRRVENRFVRAVRFAGSSSGSDFEAMNVALEGLGRIGDVSLVLSIDSDLMEEHLPYGAATMRGPMAPRIKVGRVPVKRQQASQAMSDAVKSRNLQSEQLTVSSSDLEKFVEDIIGEGESGRLDADGSGGLQEMILLSKARQIASFEEGSLADRYSFEPDGELDRNFWSVAAGGSMTRNPSIQAGSVVISRLDPPLKVKRNRKNRKSIR